MPSRRRLGRLTAHLRASTAAVSHPDPVTIRFPHCGEMRTVHPLPTEYLKGLGPGHWVERVPEGEEHQYRGSAAASAFVLRGPSVDRGLFQEAVPTPDPHRKDDAPTPTECVSEGPLELRPMRLPHDSIADMARTLEDDGLLYLPDVLRPELIARLREDFDRTPTDVNNPIDSGIGTPSNEEHRAKMLAEGQDPGWNGNKGVMSLWNRMPPHGGLAMLDAEPCCSVAEATLGPDCHLIQQKAWSTGPGRPGQHLHVDFLPLFVPQNEVLLEGKLRIPIYLITAHYYLEDMDEALGPT